MAGSPIQQPLDAKLQDKKELPSLPHTAWRRITFYLSDSLSTLLDISSLSPHLRDICRPHTSSFFRTVDRAVLPSLKPYYYHHLLRLVLEGHVDPSSIYEFIACDRYSVKPICSPTARPGLRDNATEQEVRYLDWLFRKAVSASRFIPSLLEDDVCDRLQRGDEDAAIIILLPLCTRLKMLEAPIGGSKLCKTIFQNIIQEYQRKGISAKEAQLHASEAAARDLRTGPIKRLKNDSSTGTGLPFSELLVLSVAADPTGSCFPLDEIVPFLGIPSLRCIVLSGVDDRQFTWPSNCAESNCPSIFFQQAAVSQQAVLSFAAQGLNPPCEIRQWYERPRSGNRGESESGEDDPTWDRVLIQRGIDGSKDIRCSFEFGGGNPGYNYPWVSWLCRGKMIDWTRLDEEPVLEEDDGDIEELMGLLT